MATGYDSISGASNFPRENDFYKKVIEVAKTCPPDTLLGLTRDGRVIAKSQLESQQSYLSSWFRSTFRQDVYDAKTGESFSQCEENFLKTLGRYKPESRSVSRLTFSGKAILSSVTKSIQEVPVPSAYELSEDDLTTLTVFLKQQQGSSYPSLNRDDYYARLFAIRLFNSDKESTLTLCTFLSEHSDKNLVSAKALLNTSLIPAFEKARDLTPGYPVHTEIQTIQAPEGIYQRANINGRDYMTNSQPRPFPEGIKNPKITTTQLTELDYEVEINPATVSATLQNNLERAKQCQLNEQPHENFSQILQQKPKKTDPEDCYIDAESGLSKSLKGIGFAGAGGNVEEHEMEDTQTTGRLYCSIAAHWAPVNVAAVFDGHTLDGDNSAATIASQKIISTLKQRIGQFNIDGLTEAGVYNALCAAVVDLDRAQRFDGGGSTANIAAIIGDRLWIANLGDSRAILVAPDGTTTQLSEDAKLMPEDEGDIDAAKKHRFNQDVAIRGGRSLSSRSSRDNSLKGVRVVGPGLKTGPSSAAAIGDHTHNGAVPSRPKITCVPLKDIPRDSKLILMCDGVPEVASTNQLGTLVTLSPELNAKELAEQIRDYAFQARSTDNLMVVVAPINDFTIMK